MSWIPNGSEDTLIRSVILAIAMAIGPAGPLCAIERFVCGFNSETTYNSATVEFLYTGGRRRAGKLVLTLCEQPPASIEDAVPFSRSNRSRSRVGRKAHGWVHALQINDDRRLPTFKRIERTRRRSPWMSRFMMMTRKCAESEAARSQINQR